MAGEFLLIADEPGHVIALVHPRYQDLLDAGWQYHHPPGAAPDRHAWRSFCVGLGEPEPALAQDDARHLHARYQRLVRDRRLAYRIPHPQWATVRARIAERDRVVRMPPAALVAASILGDDPAEPTKLCPYCRKPAHLMPQGIGNHVGNSTKLGKNILGHASREDHRWYLGPSSLQAHHLICSEAMAESPWPQICQDFDYDIDCRENGVMLPASMELACQLHVPQHLSNHDDGRGEPDLSYPDSVKKRLDGLHKRFIRHGRYCNQPQMLARRLHAYSQEFFELLRTFTWTITGDGEDFAPGGNGCAGATSRTNKPDRPCPKHRRHNLRHVPVQNADDATPAQPILLAAMTASTPWEIST